MLHSRTQTTTGNLSGTSHDRWSLAISLLILLAASATAVKADNLAFMSTGSGDFGTIDLNTGVFTLLGNFGVTLGGMAVANGTLYGTSYQTGSGTLYTINPANGNLTVVGTSPTNFWGFGSTTSGLYVVGLDFDLYSINPTSGAATLIGSTGLSLNGSPWYGVSTNSSALYFSAGPSLYTLDTATGAATLVGNTGGPQMGAMLLEGGILYGGEDSPTLSVATLDPATGAATTGPAVTGTSGIIYALAPFPLPTGTLLTLDPSTTPSAGDPGVTNINVTGHGFPSGTIPPVNVTVTLNPTTDGGGPSGTTTALAVTLVSGSTERVTFRIPTSISVPSTTSYQVSIAGTTSTGIAFQSGNTAALTVNPLLAITTSSPLPAGSVGVNYSQTLAAAGGSGGYTWSINTGSLPAGLSLNSATGQIAGVPTTAGASHLTIKVTDSLLATATKAFALTVPPAQLTTLSPNSGIVGQSLQVTITGAYTDFLQGSTKATLGTGISVGGAGGGQPGPVTVNSPTSATAQLFINAGAITGTRTVTVITGAEQVSLVNGFTVVPPVSTLTVLHEFSGSDGYSPGQLVIGAGGVLYGATEFGGTSSSCGGGCGTVYSLTPPASPRGNWTEAVLHSFIRSDGSYPTGVVIGSGGVLYGAANQGAIGNTVCPPGCGTVFQLKPPISPGGVWTETILHKFTGPDGAYPNGVAIGSGGILYGTTGFGTVFSLTPPKPPSHLWTETVLYVFAGGSGDGANPGVLVIGSGGVLYGTTQYGGTSNLGTVFSLTPPASPGGAWTESVLYNFTGGTGDGANPREVVIGSGGVLYGTAPAGASAACTSFLGSGCGTVFSLTPPASPGGAWTEAGLYSFTGGSDGGNPTGAVIGNGGVLYGTTGYGGVACLTGIGCGTVFSLSPPGSPGGAWTQNVLYSFTGGNDGAVPLAGVVIGGGGVLYGTTLIEGTSNAGTVFSLKP